MTDVTEIDYTTNPPTVTKRDFTPQEIAEREADRIAWETKESERAANEAAKTSARAKLAKLGLTDAEIDALTAV